MRRIAIRNLLAKPGRTAALLILTAFLAISLFAGSVIMSSLDSGLGSLESRLGADIIVVPSSAKSHTDLNNLYLQGTTGYYYMKTSVYEKIAATEGIERVSPQLFLSSLRADCCSIPVQVIGFDPETDFTIQPWLDKSYRYQLNDLDVVVGSRVTAEPGESIRIYDTSCHVVARLAQTGTGLDTAIYCTMNTVRLLMAAAEENGRNIKLTEDPDEVVSAVYIKVADGYTVDEVTNDINIHVRKVEAVKSKNMITDVSDSLAAIAGIARIIMVAVWILCLVILCIAFSMMVNERRKEFAVLRVIGATRGALGSLVLMESAVLGLVGSLLGVGIACLLIFPFQTLIETMLGLPYLLPSYGRIILYGVGTVAGVILVSCLASMRAAHRLSRVDTGTILRAEG